MTIKRLTREQIEDMQDRRHWTPLTPDQVNALCDMALAALRAQDGVVVPKQWIDWAEKIWIDTGHWDAASLHSAMIAAAETTDNACGQGVTTCPNCDGTGYINAGAK